MNKITKAAIAVAALISAPAFAGYEVKLGDDNQKLTFGGFFKIDTRHTSGDQAARDGWAGTSTYAEDTHQTTINARESRFNMKYQNGDVTGFLEYDFVGAGGNSKVTNGYGPRLRHAIIKYKNWTVGQTWSTFTPLASIADALDDGGAHVGQAVIRQSMIRYTTGGLELALENPSEDNGNNQAIPDVVGRYTFKGDWGQVAVAGLARSFDNDGDVAKADGVQLAYSVAGKIKIGRDDIRFAYNGGAGGRYISPGHNAGEVVDASGDLEKIVSYTLAYRHFWSDSLRSSLYYGHSEVENFHGPSLDSDRSHIAINLIKQLNKQLSVGIEVGNYEGEVLGGTKQADSDYLHLTAKYVL